MSRDLNYLDHGRALSEGWFLRHGRVYSNGRVWVPNEIGDAHAARHVQKRAADGSEFHQRVLAHLVEMRLAA